MSTLAADPNPRTVSLRSQWNRAFALLIVVVLLCGLSSFIGNRLLLASSHASAVQIEAQATASAVLRTDLVGQSVALASQISVQDEPAITSTELRIRTEYARAIAIEQSRVARSALADSQAHWQLILVAVGPIAHSSSLATRGVAVAANAPVALARLDQAGSAGRAAIRADIAQTERYDWLALSILAVLELLTIGIALRLNRRLSTRVFRPVRALRDAANRLANGELDHRVEFHRSDELGELAASFNVMADAIAGSQRRLSVEARTDSLSGLTNRAAFRTRLEAVLERPDRRGAQQAVLFVDLDDFKDVNDSLGHAAGDRLLQITAARLSALIRAGDTAARLGGDEFALLLVDLDDPAIASTIARRVVTALSEPVSLSGTWVNVRASVGIALRRENSTLDELMHEADLAMYTAKGKGKNRVELYDHGVDEQASLRHTLKAEIGAATALHQLVLDYQPIADLKTGALVGLEALVRWQHPTKGLLPPSAFIELAEETGAILDIGPWVLETAARQLKLWQARYERPALWMSVNVSVCQLDTPGFADQVNAVLRATRLEPATLTLEVTESVLAGPNGLAATALAELRDVGVRVALDDFGTGYSSIGYLRQLPIDAIKIDRSFVSGTYAGGPENSLLGAIVAMAQHLGLGVIPEGIEESDQLRRLRGMGCEVGQGFLLSLPVSASAVDAMLATPMPMPHVELTNGDVRDALPAVPSRD
jgi:diguanylate cyclase (GGDEF)-like protein